MSQTPPSCQVRTWEVDGSHLGGGHTLLMAIFNVTPDSFFDGGVYQAQDAFEARYQECLEQNVDIIDLGAESSRPGAASVSVEDEWARLEPAFNYLKSVNNKIPISIDTTKASVADLALRAGATIVNDISALTLDPEMPGVIIEHNASICLNHLRGTPRTMQVNPHYDDLMADIIQDLGTQIQKLLNLGLSQSKICVDPGIGFGKNLDHNMKLIWNLSQLDSLECPILMGMSRKSYIGQTPGLENSDRLVPSLGSALIAEMAGASILRVHDIKETREILTLVSEMRARS